MCLDRLLTDPGFATLNRSDRLETTNGEPFVMGDERQSTSAAETAGLATTSVAAAPGAKATGGDQDALRSPTAEAEIGGEHGERRETAAEAAGSIGRPLEETDGIGAWPQARSEDVEGTTGDRGAPDHGEGLRLGSPADAETEASEHEAEVEAGMTLEIIEGHVLRAIRYHEARARFLDFWRRVFDFLVVVLGAGAVTSATTDYKVLGTIIGIALAAIGALQLVAGFSEKAGEHTSLKRRFCDVLARITEARGEPEVTDRNLAKITKRWTAIWADEPPTMHVLEAIAWNAARRTREHDLDEDTLIAIGWWHSLTRNLSSWESFEPLTRAELAQRKRSEMPWWTLLGKLR